MANTVNLGKGIMEVYDFGAVKLHAYKTNDLITDECFLVEKDKEAFLIESPCFFDNIAELEKYIDDAYIAGLPSITIIHGRGTGALRAAVQNYLKRNRNVKKFRNGEFGEGDAGVTIAELKQN